MIYTQLSRILCNDRKNIQGTVHKSHHPSINQRVTLLNKRGNGVWKLSIKCWCHLWTAPKAILKKKKKACLYFMNFGQFLLHIFFYINTYYGQLWNIVKKGIYLFFFWFFAVTVFSWRLITTIQGQQFHLTTDCDSIVGLLKKTP